MKEKYVSITGFRNYNGTYPFKIGSLVRCDKEPDNQYDNEALKCTMPILGTVGYIANSCSTVAGGTMSAGRIYDKVGKRFYVRVLFTTFTKIICRVEDGDADELKRELLSQIYDRWDAEENEDFQSENEISDSEEDK